MPDSTTLLRTILELTRTMREHALDSDWESVRATESSRQALIECCFPLDESVASPARAADAIQEIIELDKSVISLAAVAREEMGNSLGKLRLGRQATSAYASVETGG